MLAGGPKTLDFFIAPSRRASRWTPPIAQRRRQASILSQISDDMPHIFVSHEMGVRPAPRIGSLGIVFAIQGMDRRIPRRSDAGAPLEPDPRDGRPARAEGTVTKVDNVLMARNYRGVVQGGVDGRIAFGRCRFRARALSITKQGYRDPSCWSHGTNRVRFRTSHIRLEPAIQGD